MNIIRALEIALRLMRFQRNKAQDNAEYMSGSHYVAYYVQEAHDWAEAVRLLEEDQQRHKLEGKMGGNIGG